MSIFSKEFVLRRLREGSLESHADIARMLQTSTPFNLDDATAEVPRELLLFWELLRVSTITSQFGLKTYFESLRTERLRAFQSELSRIKFTKLWQALEEGRNLFEANELTGLQRLSDKVESMENEIESLINTLLAESECVFVDTICGQ